MHFKFPTRPLGQAMPFSRYVDRPVPEPTWSEDRSSMTHRFGTVETLMAYAAAKAGSAARAHEDEAAWPGASLQDAFTLARDGWPEAAAAISPLAAAHVSSIGARTILPVPRFDVCGESVDVGAFMSGEPESFLAFDQAETVGPGKILNVSYNCGVSGGVDVDVIVARGAATVALVQLLELSGYSVEITLAFGIRNEDGSRTSYCTAKVKAADQPADYDRIAFWLAHPAVMRRLGFAVFDGWGWSPQNHPCDVPEDLRGDIHVIHAHLRDKQWMDPKSARAWIAARLKEQGVEVTEAA